MHLTNYREIDKLGRVVIPKDIRNHLHIEPGDILRVSADNDSITIRKAEDKCVFCGSQEALRELEGKFICEDCVKKLL